MKTAVLILLFIFTTYAQQWDWIIKSQRFRNYSPGAVGYSVDIDDSGNVFMGGCITDSTTFCDTLIYTPRMDLFGMKLSPQGIPVWIKNTGGNSNGNSAHSVVTDNHGNCFITGYINSICSFDTIIVDANGPNAAFYIAKINPQGTFEWVKAAGRTLQYASSDATDMVISKENELYVTGYFKTHLYLQNQEISSYGETDIFIAKFDANGVLKWLRHAGSPTDDFAYSIAVDSLGDCYITGQINNGFKAGQIILQTNGSSTYIPDGVIAKLDSQGNFLWAKDFGSTSTDYGTSLSYSPFGSIYVTGVIRGPAQFGNTTVPYHGGDDMFIAKYNLDGSLSFAKGFGGASNESGNGIYINRLGNVLVTGEFTGTGIFDTTSIYSSGENDLFAAEFDYNGFLKWITKYGSVNYDYGTSITSDRNGNVYLTGAVEGVGNVLFKSYNFFIGKIIDPVTPVELTSFNSAYSSPYVRLSWSTATELNNRIFEIERSYDSKSWICIGTRKGQGTTSTVHQYTYSDDITGISSLKLYYRLKQIDYNGNFKYSDISEVDIVPGNAKLFQNFPNPFNASTVIKFSIPKSSTVTLKLLNILGEEVKTLVNETKEAGIYDINFDASSLPSGIYFCRMQSGNFTETKKIILMK